MGLRRRSDCAPLQPLLECLRTFLYHISIATAKARWGSDIRPTTPCRRRYTCHSTKRTTNALWQTGYATINCQPPEG
ncbi:MAG: hypothetical protein JNJ94_07415 [Chlorobi bacterium]|nr:hypothetical protein [Chlorobiota bacterium]